MSQRVICFETNWIVGAVLGQDAQAEEFLRLRESTARLAVPSVCLMETISAFDQKRGERNQLKAELERQLAQLSRSGEISTARQLTAQLIQAKLTNDKLLNELFHRLDELLDRVAQRSELIHASAGAIQLMIQLLSQTDLERADALILACILAHAATKEDHEFAFLTGNVHDFGKPPVRRILGANGVRLFGSTEAALRWAAAGGVVTVFGMPRTA